MRIVSRAALAALTAIAAIAAPGAAATISFADQQVGELPGTLSFPDATFTSNTGRLYVGAAGGDHALCPLDNSNCAAALTVTFSSPVDHLVFQADGDNSAASSVFVSGTSAAGDFDFTASGFDGLLHTFTTIDLSAFGGVTSIRITNDDPAGLGYDFFSFDTLSGSGTGAGAVPEPASWALMLSGLGLVGQVMRRRQAAAANA